MDSDRGLVSVSGTKGCNGSIKQAYPRTTIFTETTSSLSYSPISKMADTYDFIIVGGKCDVLFI